MSTTRRAPLGLLVVVLTAMLLPLMSASPANAEKVVRPDARGDDHDSTDITRLVVRHRPRSVVITVVYADRRKPEEMWLQVDRPRTKRFDHHLGTGFMPRWYSIWTRRSHLNGPPKCSLKKRRNFADRIRLVVPRRCFDEPRRVRVRVAESDDDLQDDLMGNPGSWDATRWSRWAKRG